MMRKFNSYGFFTLFGILFLIILYKVINVPVTTDEVPTVFFYSKFSFWDIMMFPDNIPNNHILNTLLAKCCIMTFGKEPWAIRLPNLLIFIVFGLSVFKILKLILKRDSYFFIPAAILFMNPYWLDFFGLCRGYGISSTLVTLSVAFLMEAFLVKKQKKLWYALTCAMLASYANFSALDFWVAATIMVWLYFFIGNIKNMRKLITPTVIIFIISIAYMALIIIPIRKMESTSEFQYWTSTGFYDETIKSLIIDWWYDSKILPKIHIGTWTGLLVIVIFSNIVLLINKFKKSIFSLQSLYHPVFVTTSMLVLPALINISQSKILGTPNLNGRTALFFFPLVSAVLATSLSLIPNDEKKKRLNKLLATLLGFIFIINLTDRISLHKVREWSYDQSTTEVINFLKDKSDGRQISLKTSWFFHPSFYFYSDAGKDPWIDLQPYDKNIDINTPAEYYYIFAKDYKLLEPRFKVVYKFSPNRWLLKQKQR